MLAEFVACYTDQRPPALYLQTSRPTVRPAAGPIGSRALLGGLHHAYERAA
jgi:hypothetical protein